MFIIYILPMPAYAYGYYTYKARSEELQQRPHGSQNLKYFLCGPLPCTPPPPKKKIADHCKNLSYSFLPEEILHRLT